MAPAPAASATSRTSATSPPGAPARPSSTALISTPTSGCLRTIALASNSSAAYAELRINHSMRSLRDHFVAPSWVDRVGTAHNRGGTQRGDQSVGRPELAWPQRRRRHRRERLELLRRVGLQVDVGSRILSANNLSNSGSPNPCKYVTGLCLTLDTSLMIFSNNPKSMKPRFLDSVSRGHMTHSALQ